MGLFNKLLRVNLGEEFKETSQQNITKRLHPLSLTEKQQQFKGINVQILSIIINRRYSTCSTPSFLSEETHAKKGTDLRWSVLRVEVDL